MLGGQRPHAHPPLALPPPPPPRARSSPQAHRTTRARGQHSSRRTTTRPPTQPPPRRRATCRIGRTGPSRSSPPRRYRNPGPWPLAHRRDRHPGPWPLAHRRDRPPGQKMSDWVQCGPSFPPHASRTVGMCRWASNGPPPGCSHQHTPRGTRGRMRRSSPVGMHAYRGHMHTEATCIQRPHAYRGRMHTEAACVAAHLWACMHTEATCIQRPHAYRGRMRRSSPVGMHAYARMCMCASACVSEHVHTFMCAL